MNVLTVSQAAKLLGIEPATIRRQIALGAITAQKLGWGWVITSEEVERYATESSGKRGRKPKS